MSRNIQCPLCIRIKQFFLALNVFMQCLIRLTKHISTLLKELIWLPKGCITIYLLFLAPNINQSQPLPQPSVDHGKAIYVIHQSASDW